MNSEKVKEIKKALEQTLDYCARELEGKLFQDCLTLINELESENKELNSELKRYKMDWLNSEKMHLQADMEDTEFELFCANKSLDEVRAENKILKDRIAELESKLEKEQINNLNCDTELQYKEKRIAELEKKVCGNEELHTLVEKLNYMTILKKFAEKVKDSLEEYRLENEYFTENEPNGNLWQMNASVFCIEVTQDGGLIDQLAKECLNGIAKDYGVEL